MTRSFARSSRQKRRPSTSGNAACTENNKKGNNVKNAETPPTEPNPLNAILARLIACLQSTGRAGKSTTAECLITALRFAGVAYQAYDADGEHRTLSRRYPDDVERFDSANNPEEFGRLMQQVSPALPVTLIDFPAQATSFLLGQTDRLGLLDVWEAQGIRPTLLIFAADDDTAMASAAMVKRAFETRADYVLVENPARFKSVRFNQTPLRKWLVEQGSPTFIIPPVLESTMGAWLMLERRLKRYIPLDEACRSGELHDLQKGELQFLRDRCCAQFEEHAAFFLPDVKLIKNRLPKARQRLPRPEINPLEDPLY
jgi:hypothetical protein